MFDLDVLETKTRSQEGVDMPVCGFDGKPLKNKKKEPITLKLLGPDSDAYRDGMRANVKKRMEAASGGKEISAEETDNDALNTLMDLTVGWSGFLDKEGNPIQFSGKALLELYKNYPAIRDQADTFISKRSNFTLASSKS
jgi:hypothetical protein